MSILRRMKRWLAQRFRPAEPGPLHKDLNLPVSSVQEKDDLSQDSELSYAQKEEKLRREHSQYRRACYRSGPWQQK